MVKRSGNPVVNGQSIVVGVIGTYAISMMYIPLHGSMLLGGFARLYVMLFWGLSAYIALHLAYSLLKRIVPEGISAVVSSAMAAAALALACILYAANIFFINVLGTYVTYDLVVMSLNQAQVGGFFLHTMGPVYQITFLNLVAAAVMLFYGTYAVLYNHLANRGSLDGGVVRLWLLAALALSAGLLSQYSTVVTASEPVIVFAKSFRDAATLDYGSSHVVRDIPDISVRRNVLLVQVDSLRAANMGLYGYGRDTTPNIDRLARRGLVVEMFYSTSGVSEYITASIVNGIYPCRRTTAYPNLFEIMKRNGYRTSVFSSGDNRWFNMNERFFSVGVDSFFDYRSYSRDKDISWNTIGGYYIDDGVAVGKANEWLRGLNRSENFLLYLNLCSTHATYYFNRSMEGLYTPYYEGDDVMGLVESIKGRQPSAINTYDNSIRYLDEQVGYVLSALDELNRTDDTVIIFVSDHGEEFMEHGRMGHGTSAYDEQVRVPFIVSYPGANGTTYVGLGQHIDIVPTLMGVLGAEAGPGYDGINLLAENRSSAYFCGEDEGLVRGEYKYFRSRVTGEEWLFNIAEDPSETRNLVDGYEEVLEEMKGEYDAFNARLS